MPEKIGYPVYSKKKDNLKLNRSRIGEFIMKVEDKTLKRLFFGRKKSK